MTIQDMSYVISTRYNVILHYMSSVQNITIFPPRTRPPSNIRQYRLISMGHVPDYHFVQVK